MKLLKIFTIAFSILAISNVSKAELKIDITDGTFEPIPIAVMDLQSDKDSSKAIGASISKVIKSDLQSSGLFAPIDNNSFVRKTEDIGLAPHYNDWTVINAKALINGKITEQGSDKLKVEFYLWDVVAQKKIIAQSLITDKNNWRRISHIIADIIYKNITGEEGYFDTRIIYVAESGPVVGRTKKMAIVDQDGENLKYLTTGKVPVFNPNFSPVKQEITYMTYYQGRPQVYLFNIETGRQTLIGNFDGMSFAPRFSPDGKKLIMDIAKNGNTDIYELDLNSKKMSRLTSDLSIDSSGTYSPDGSKIAFVSDRSGTPQLYTMNDDGGNQERISFSDGRYGDPAWSPRGDYIAFVKIKDGAFYLGVMSPDGSNERLLTKAFDLESPSWSPNGRRIIYYKQIVQPGKADTTKVYSIDITGYNERMLPTPTDASDPSWSPLLK